MTSKQRSKINDSNTNTDTSLAAEVRQQSMVFLNNNGIVASDRLTMLTQNPHKSTHIHSSMTLKVHYVYPHNCNKTANQPPTRSPRLKDTLPHLTHPHTWETRQSRHQPQVVKLVKSHVLCVRTGRNQRHTESLSVAHTVDSLIIPAHVVTRETLNLPSRLYHLLHSMFCIQENIS